MKKLLKFFAGILVLFFITSLNYIAFGILIKFSLNTIFLMFIVQIIITIFLYIFFKDKLVKIGLLLPSIIFLFYIGYNLHKELVRLENKNYYSNEYKEEDDEEIRRESLMKDTTISLYEKLNKIKPGKITDSLIILFSIENVKTPYNYAFKINSLDIDFSNFGLQKMPDEEYFYDTNKFYYLNNQLKIVTKNSDTIAYNLYNNKGDSLVYVGYLPENKLFILKEGLSELGNKYTSINWENSQEIDGIPLFSSKDKKYYCFIYFYQVIGYIEIRFKYWKKDINGYYQEIHEEIIPTGIFLEDQNPYEIFYIGSENSTFKFIITYNNNIKNEKESVLIKSKIINLEEL